MHRLSSAAVARVSRVRPTVIRVSSTITPVPIPPFHVTRTATTFSNSPSYTAAPATPQSWHPRLIALFLSATWFAWWQNDEVHAAAAASGTATDSVSVTTQSKPIYRSLPPTATPVERQAVEALRASLSTASLTLDPALRSYVAQWALDDDWTLLRYLRAHKLHVSHAQAGLLATAQWRLHEGVDDIRVGEFADIYAKGLMYVSTSTDPVGRAVIINRKSPHPSIGWNDHIFRKELRSLVYTMERAIREMEDRLARGEADPAQMDAKWVFLVDMGHYNTESATPWHVTKSLVDLMRLHYPERLHLAIIVDAPWILRSLLKLLRPVIPKVTRDKVLFITDRYSAANTQLITRTIGTVAALPEETGIPGAATKFDFQRYIEHDPLALPRPKEKGATHAAQSIDSSDSSVSSALQKLKFW